MTRGERTTLALLLAAVVVVYVRGVAGQPVDWDDDVWLSDPVLLASPAEAVKLALTTTRDQNWAPAMRLSFATWIRLGGPPLLHAVAIGLYAATVAWTWVFLRRLGLGAGVVLGAVAPWALHPTKVECVSWLTGLKDVQSGAALAGAAVLATLPATQGRALGFGALCALAGATKAATFPVPFVIFAAVGAVAGREEALRRTRAGLAVAIGIAGVGLAEWGPGPTVPAGERLARIVEVYGAFCAKLVPTSLPAALTPLPSLPVALGWGLAVTGALVAFAVRDRRGWLALAGWILPLVPFLGLVHMTFFGSDRHLLFASLGPFLALALALGEARARSVGLGLALLLAVPTALRVPEWRSSLALWEAEATRPGEHWVRGHKLGTALGKAGRFAEAEAAFDRSLAANPDDMPTLARRLIASLATDGWTTEDAAASKALQPPPTDARGWQRAAEGLRKAGRPELAAMAIRRAEQAFLDERSR